MAITCNTWYGGDCDRCLLPLKDFEDHDILRETEREVLEAARSEDWMIDVPESGKMFCNYCVENMIHNGQLFENEDGEWKLMW